MTYPIPQATSPPGYHGFVREDALVSQPVTDLARKGLVKGHCRLPDKPQKMKIEEIRTDTTRYLHQGPSVGCLILVL